MDKTFCEYYHVGVQREKTWFVVGCFRNEDHVAFERTLEGQSDILEFFVPRGQEDFFLHIIQYLKEKNYVHWIEKKENRFESM